MVHQTPAGKWIIQPVLKSVGVWCAIVMYQIEYLIACSRIVLIYIYIHMHSPLSLLYVVSVSITIVNFSVH